MRGLRARRFFLRVGPMAALAALLVLFFLPLAEAGKTFVFRDLVVYTAPQDRALREAVLERHELPARNPYVYAGVEHAADPCSQVFYPPRLATALAFRVPRSLEAFVVLHFALATAGAYLLARALRATRLASIAGAAVYALSGPVLSLAENFPLLAGAAWLPFSLAFALRAARLSGRKRRRALALAGATIALAVLGGDLQGAVWASLLVLSVLVVAAVRRGRDLRESARGFLEAALPVTLALGLAAALLLPTWFLREKTDRAAPPPEAVAGAFSLAPERLAELAVPFPFGRSFPEGKTFVAAFEPRASQVTEPWSETIHVGIVGFLLGLASLADPKRRLRAGALAGLFFLALLVAMGPRLGALGPWHFLRRILPFYDVFRYPEKHLVLAALAASGLASLGVDALTKARVRKLVGAIGVTSGLACFVAAPLLHAPLERSLEQVVTAAHRPADPAASSLLAGAIEIHAFYMGEVLLLTAALALLWKWRRLVLLLAPLLVAADVAIANRQRLFLGDATLYDERPLGADLVRASGSRVLRWPLAAAAPIGRVFSADEMPLRRQRERAIAARVRSWSGSVAANERASAAHGFASFTPLAILHALPPRELPDPGELDALAVRFLVLEERLAARSGIAVVASSSNGVALVDRGEGVPPAPPATFGGEVAGLAPGVLLSCISLVAAISLGFLPARKTTGA